MASAPIRLPWFWPNASPWESLQRHFDAGSTVQIMVRDLTSRPERKKPIGPSGADMPKLFVPKLSEIELLVAIDVIRSAIAEHRKHLDLEALRSALAKLTAAYGGENRGRAR